MIDLKSRTAVGEFALISKGGVRLNVRAENNGRNDPSNSEFHLFVSLQTAASGLLVHTIALS